MEACSQRFPETMGGAFLGKVAELDFGMAEAIRTKLVVNGLISQESLPVSCEFLQILFHV